MYYIFQRWFNIILRFFLYTCVSKTCTCVEYGRVWSSDTLKKNERRKTHIGFGCRGEWTDFHFFIYSVMRLASRCVRWTSTIQDVFACVLIHQAVQRTADNEVCWIYTCLAILTRACWKIGSSSRVASLAPRDVALGTPPR